jgi:hypothetical protein
MGFPTSPSNVFLNFRPPIELVHPHYAPISGY